MRLRELIDLVETIGNRDHTFYHVTLTENLPSIMECGLMPSIGDRSKKLGDGSCVFLFPDEDSAEDAVANWLGKEFGEEVALALLEVTVPPEIEVFQTSGVDWEYYTKKAIPPEGITILNRNF